jgi:hypothetical protein
MPARIDTGGSYADDPQIGFDGQGNAFAVWEQEDYSNGTATVWTSTRPAGGSWTAPASFDASAPSAGGGFTLPHLAVSANGTAVAVWEQIGAGNASSPWASIYTPGSGWSAAVQVDPPVGNARSAPRVAIDPKGNAAMVWIGGSTTGFTWAMGSRFAAGGSGWSTPVRLSTGTDAGTGSGDTFPDIAMDAQGNAMAVWASNGTHAIWAARFFAPSGMWSSPTTIVECPGCTFWPLAHVAVDAAGDAFAIWTWDAVTGGEQTYAAHYTAASSNWSAPVQLDANLPTGGYDGYESVAVNASGLALAVWINFAVDAGSPVYRYASLWTGAAWTPAVQIGAAPYGQGSAYPAVADTGDALAVWSDNNSIYGTFLPAGSSTWGTPVALNAGTQPVGAVVAFAPGTCSVGLAAWQDTVGTLEGVFTSFYR